MVTSGPMRILIAGLVLIALGIGLSEYQRRHEEAPAPGAAKKKKNPPVANTPPSTKALIETAAPAADEPGDTAALTAALASLQSDAKVDGLTTVLSGAFTARDVVTGSTFAVAVVGVGGQSGLVRIAAGEPVKALVARKNAITALAVDGATVWWAEGQRVFSVDAEGKVAVKTQFATASVLGLAAKNGTVVAALVPKDGDPFSTDPTGALVKLNPDGTAALVVGEQVRPHDVLIEGSDAFFVAGYPSALVRASLDGSFSAQIAERADGPLAFDGEGLVHRFPQTGAPEVRRVARAGGSQVTLARGDVDWLTAAGGVTRYTTVGIGARVYEVKPDEAAKEVVAFKGVAKGLALAGPDHLVLVATTDDGTTSIRVK